MTPNETIKETLYIKNFAGIEELTMEVKPINIIIGPQASGKSVVIKLLYFFKSMREELQAVSKNRKNRDFKELLTTKFLNYFPISLNNQFIFQIRYTHTFSISISSDANRKLVVDFDTTVSEVIPLITELNDKKDSINHFGSTSYDFEKLDLFRHNLGNWFNARQIFIPASRSFFAYLKSNVFSLLDNRSNFDSFIMRFGQLYNDIKFDAKTDFTNKSEASFKFDELISLILKGEYYFDSHNNKDYIIHKNNRKVELEYTSSGQQEALPMLVILQYLNINLNKNNTALYIEEPEAHLFPTAQNNIVKLLARTFNSKEKDFQFFITTHSPYILSAFNTLIKAGKIERDKLNKNGELYKIIPKEEILFPKDVAAYSLSNGKLKHLYDEETELIDENILDEVSEEMSEDFGKLLDIQYGE